MNAVGVARNKGVPLRQVLALRESAVSATRWQPLELARAIGDQDQALRDFLRSIPVITAPTGLHVEQAAGNVRIEHLIGILILDLVQTAQRTTVTERLPLFPVHLREGFAFPKGFGHRPVLCDTTDRIST